MGERGYWSARWRLHTILPKPAPLVSTGAGVKVPIIVFEFGGAGTKVPIIVFEFSGAGVKVPITVLLVGELMALALPWFQL